MIGFGGMLWFLTWFLASIAVMVGGVSAFRAFVKDEGDVPKGVQVAAYIGLTALAIFINAVAFGMYALAHSG